MRRFRKTRKKSPHWETPEIHASLQNLRRQLPIVGTFYTKVLAETIANFNHHISEYLEQNNIEVDDVIMPKFLKTNRKRPEELVNIACEVHPYIRVRTMTSCHVHLIMRFDDCI